MRWGPSFRWFALAALVQTFVLSQTLSPSSISTTAVVSQTQTAAPTPVSTVAQSTSTSMASGIRHASRPARVSHHFSSVPSGAIKPKMGPKKHRRRPVHPVVIMFSVLGGLMALGLLVALGRCIAARKRGPKRDRIAEVMERHRLHQELDHLNRNSFFSVPAHHDPEPAPPYYPPPPTYDASGASVIHSTHRNGYINLSSGSPPPGQSAPLPDNQDPLNRSSWPSANEPLLATTARHRLDSSA